MKKIKNILRSVLHKNCGGEIVLVANKEGIKLACKKCQIIWDITIPMLGANIGSSLSNDMELYENS